MNNVCELGIGKKVRLPRRYSVDTSSSTSTDSNQDQGALKYKSSDKIHMHRIDSKKILIVAMIVILLDFMFRDVIFQYELGMIQKFRDFYNKQTMDTICRFIIFFTEIRFIKGFCIVLYLYSDPLLAFKTGILTYIAIYTITTLKIMYSIPRPFWLDEEIDTSLCKLDFSGPSDHTWVGCFFYTYVILVYFYKYAEKKNFILISCLLAANCILMLLTSFALFMLGQTFLFESTVGIIYSTLFALVCLNIDEPFSKYCEKLAFDIYMSRRYKFYALFTCMGVFVVNIIQRRFMLDHYRILHNWVNTPWVRQHGFKYNIGIDYSFFDYSIIFTIIGCIFGCSFATTRIDNYLIRRTPLWKRIVRTIIGFSIWAVIYTIARIIYVDNYPSDFILKKWVPHFMIAYFAYGLYPCTWLYFGLVDYEDDSSDSDYSVTVTHPKEERSHSEEDHTPTRSDSKFVRTSYTSVDYKSTSGVGFCFFYF